MHINIRRALGVIVIAACAAITHHQLPPTARAGGQASVTVCARFFFWNGAFPRCDSAGGRSVAYDVRFDTTGAGIDLTFVPTDSSWLWCGIPRDITVCIWHYDDHGATLVAESLRVAGAVLADTQITHWTTLGDTTIAPNHIRQGIAGVSHVFTFDAITASQIVTTADLTATGSVQLPDTAAIVIGTTYPLRGKWTMTPADSEAVVSNPYWTRRSAPGVKVGDLTQCAWADRPGQAAGTGERPYALGCSCAVAESLDLLLYCTPVELVGRRISWLAYH